MSPSGTAVHEYPPGHVDESASGDPPPSSEPPSGAPASHVDGHVPALPFGTQTPHAAGPQHDHSTWHIWPPHRPPPSRACPTGASPPWEASSPPATPLSASPSWPGAWAPASALLSAPPLDPQPTRIAVSVAAVRELRRVAAFAGVRIRDT